MEALPAMHQELAVRPPPEDRSRAMASPGANTGRIISRHVPGITVGARPLEPSRHEAVDHLGGAELGSPRRPTGARSFARPAPCVDSTRGGQRGGQ